MSILALCSWVLKCVCFDRRLADQGKTPDTQRSTFSLQHLQARPKYRHACDDEVPASRSRGRDGLEPSLEPTGPP